MVSNFPLFVLLGQQMWVNRSAGRLGEEGYSSVKPQGYHTEFACGKSAGKIANGDHVIMGSCNHDSEPVAKLLSHSHMTSGVLQLLIIRGMDGSIKHSTLSQL